MDVKEGQVNIKKLSEYEPLDFVIKHCDLEFFLGAERTKVISTCFFQVNEKSTCSDKLKKVFSQWRKVKINFNKAR